MNDTQFKVRRATVDDLPLLTQLLSASLLPAGVLEKRFTEFQVVENQEGTLVAALGLQIAGKHGKVHSESFADFALTDTLRPLLWERLQSVATNHQLVRLWTRESAPFWKQSAGFASAEQDVRNKVPAAFGAANEPWLTLKLKEDIETVLSADKEFAMFMESEKARTEEVFAHAKMLKGFAYVLAIILFLFVVAASVYVFKASRNQGSSIPIQQPSR